MIKREREEGREGKRERRERDVGWGEGGKVFLHSYTKILLKI